MICPVLEPPLWEAGMKRTSVLQEVRLMRFETLLDQHERGWPIRLFFDW